MGVLNSESVRKMRSKSCIKVEKGARNVCFMTETWCIYIYMVCILYVYCMYIVCVWYVGMYLYGASARHP